MLYIIELDGKGTNLKDVALRKGSEFFLCPLHYGSPSAVVIHQSCSPRYAWLFPFTIHTENRNQRATSFESMRERDSPNECGDDVTDFARSCDSRAPFLKPRFRYIVPGTIPASTSMANSRGSRRLSWFVVRFPLSLAGRGEDNTDVLDRPWEKRHPGTVAAVRVTGSNWSHGTNSTLLRIMTYTSNARSFREVSASLTLRFRLGVSTAMCLGCVSGNYHAIVFLTKLNGATCLGMSRRGQPGLCGACD